MSSRPPAAHDQLTPFQCTTVNVSSRRNLPSAFV